MSEIVGHAEGCQVALRSPQHMQVRVAVRRSSNSGYGAYAQSIHITGDGELIVTGGNATGAGGQSYGLYVNTYFLMGSDTVTANTISTSSGQAMNVLPMYYDKCANGGCLVKAGADQASTSLVAAPVLATFTGNKYVKIQTPPRASTPNTTFSFDGANAGQLLGTTAQMKYSLDGGNTWVACTASNPTGGATRAQLAAVLQRFIENVLK